MAAPVNATAAKASMTRFLQCIEQMKGFLQQLHVYGPEHDKEMKLVQIIHETFAEMAETQAVNDPGAEMSDLNPRDLKVMIGALGVAGLDVLYTVDQVLSTQ
jgi:hypothetical protein